MLLSPSFSFSMRHAAAPLGDIFSYSEAVSQRFQKPSNKAPAQEAVRLQLTGSGSHYQLSQNSLKIVLNVFRSVYSANADGNVEKRVFRFTATRAGNQDTGYWITGSGANLHLTRTGNNYSISGLLNSKNIQWQINRAGNSYSASASGASLWIHPLGSQITINGSADFSKFSKLELTLLTFSSTLLK